ncbi:MAG TPA: 4Fe-4S dicluster domain-containing protein [Geminicoccaceae bacterium]|nr:4Fe-4S dicluster domain-containing protein [Geminicoccus sp.]HMU51689.1 4Fe-4S dicluster domain-containing protein [Geminicoccaceae bacterium]
MSIAATRRGLLLGRSAAPPPAPAATIGDACLAFRGVVCRSCGDVCPERAIRFPPQLRRAATPVLDAAVCTGCGDCLPVCPAAAITLAAAETADAG